MQEHCVLIEFKEGSRASPESRAHSGQFRRYNLMVAPNALLRCARLAATFDAGEGVFGISSAEVSFLCVVALRGGVRENSCQESEFVT